MEGRIYNSIDELDPDQIGALDTGLDFSYGLLRVMERSLWGELAVRYAIVEDSRHVVAFTPVYVGSNLNFNALLPRFIQSAYNGLVANFGSAVATRVAVVGSLISDRGWIPMHPAIQDRERAVRLLLRAVNDIARQDHAQLGMLKDIHRDFPEAERALMRADGFVEGFSLPTIRVNTDFPSFEAFITRHLSKNGRKHARKQFKKAEGRYTLRVVEDFESIVPQVFPLFRAVFLKAKYQFEELPPGFLVECARCSWPLTELVLCERHDGRLVGVLLIFYDRNEQQNKRIGIDYEMEDSGLIYNLLNYTGIERAIAHGVKTLWLGQSSYLPKTRLGGELEDQYLLLKAFDVMLKPSLPFQKWWMSRYSAANVRVAVQNGTSI